MRTLVALSECDGAVAHATGGSEGGQGSGDDAGDDLQNGLPSFFLHSLLVFLRINTFSYSKEFRRVGEFLF